jgi:ABC-type multidrug transport system ATPase subunit
MTITIRELSKTYKGGVTALDGVSMEIPTGMFGLLGPNGAGKSTMIKILATLLEPSSGQVVVDGLDVSTDRRKIRSRLGYLPQEFGVYPKMKAREFLDFIARLDGISSKSERNRRVDELLEKVGLAEAARRKVKALSGGMLRRLGIAQALIGEPKLLVVDEPTVGLDPEERIRFRGLLQDIGREIVIILSTHIVGDISSTCENLVILDKGKLRYQGSPPELTAMAQGKTWETVAEEKDLPEIKRHFSVISTAPRGDRLHLRLVGEGPSDGLELKPVTPNLEDGYINFMGGLEEEDHV